MTLLETLRALAPVVTPGEWGPTVRQGYHEVLAPDASTDWYGHAGRHALLYGDTELSDNENESNARLICILRNALPELIASLEVVELVRDEDWLAERISDSLDVDWRPIDAARAIIAALPKETDNAHD